MKSNPVKVSGKLFRYDFDRSVVEYIIKADAETIDAEIEWEQKHGSQLYGVGADGYIVLASAGLRKKLDEHGRSKGVPERMGRRA